MGCKQKNRSYYPTTGSSSTDNDLSKQTASTPCHYRVVYRGRGDFDTMCRIATQIHEDIEKKKKKQRKSGADMIETKIRIVYKEVEDIYLKKWMANQKKKEEKEKKEQEEQKIMNIKERFKDMTWHFARKGVHVFLAQNKTKNKKIWK